MDTFLSHRHQLYFDVHIERFRTSFALPRADARRPHACLINAVYLIACHLTPSLAHHGDYFLSRARAALTHALERADRLFNYIQASGLITMYLLGQGRVLEAYYLMGATSRFAVGSGLHQIASPVWREATASSPVAAFLPPPPRIESAPMLDHPANSIELGERIAGWWQVWAVDRIGSIHTALPGALTDDLDPVTRIDTCWPRSMHDFIHVSCLIPRFYRFHSPFSIGNRV